MNGWRNPGVQNNTRAMRYEEIKASLLREGRLFEDPDFPAGPSAINNRPGGTLSIGGVKWKRPTEIIQNPKFFVDNATRFDLIQGELKDCWFIAGTACLATSSPELMQRVVPANQDFENNYAGIFRFNFWFYDTWKEVVVDDRLPTVSGRLVFASNNSQPNEFWVPLIEKAYAKLYGCYGNLEGGFSNDALVDFTGGISEMIDLKAARRSPNGGADLYDILYSMMQKSSLLGCHIAAARIPEMSLSSGLYTGHAYSITNLVKLKIKDKSIKLLRIRNPWGKGEWKGPWRDTSSEWKSIPDKVKADVGMTVGDDGEFWMSFEDWLQNFEFLTLCHLSPDGVTEEIEAHKGRPLWVEQKHQAEWLRGFSAGGSGRSPNEDMFWRNPQFAVTIGPASRGGVASTVANQKYHMVVSLMQIAPDMKYEHAISVFLYQLNEGVQLLDGRNYDKQSMLLAKSAPVFINLREVTVHYEVPPGNYIVIPCTYQANESGKFLLRIYTETQTDSAYVDMKTTISQPMIPKDDLGEVFRKFSAGDDKMDAFELLDAFNHLLNNEGFQSFGIETARCLLGLLDHDRSGLLSLEEFRKLITELRRWKDKFQAYDTDRSGNIDTYELVKVFEAIGFQISRRVQESIIRRYGGKNNRLSLNDFLHCASKLVNMYEQFERLAKNNNSSKTVQVSLEDWLAIGVYY